MIRSSHIARLIARPSTLLEKQISRSYHPAIVHRQLLQSPIRVCIKSQTLKIVASTTANFSSTTKNLRPSGTVDEELVAKIDSEIGMEKQVNETAEIPAPIKEYLENGPFTLNDKPGHEEVELVRKFGEETIRVLFSVADLDSVDDKLEDSALYDEDSSEASEEGEEEVKPKKALAKTSTQTTMNETEEEDAEFEEDAEPAYPVRLNVTIEKPNQGALQIETVAQDGMILIENVHFHKSAQLATAQTAEADYERRGHYVGPPFGNLDEDLQMLLERYLDERGINTALALFVPDYIDYKEQKEYVTWLENVKTFVKA